MIMQFTSIPCLRMHRARRVNVYLSVYELLSFDKYNGYLVPIGLGAYHTGIEIYGEEISYGYHEANHSGIFVVEPRSAPECRYIESLFVGETELSYTQVKSIIEQMGDEYTGPSYNVFTKNCNHFTTEFARRLTGQEPPSYVNRLASVGNFFKCFLPIDDIGRTPEAQPMKAVESGYRLTEDPIELPEDSDKEAKRALLANAASARLSGNR